LFPIGIRRLHGDAGSRKTVFLKTQTPFLTNYHWYSCTAGKISYCSLPGSTLCTVSTLLTPKTECSPGHSRTDLTLLFVVAVAPGESHAAIPFTHRRRQRPTLKRRSSGSPPCVPRCPRVLPGKALFSPGWRRVPVGTCWECSIGRGTSSRSSHP
jgi:hypothetical protein